MHQSVVGIDEFNDLKPSTVTCTRCDRHCRDPQLEVAESRSSNVTFGWQRERDPRNGTTRPDCVCQRSKRLLVRFCIDHEARTEFPAYSTTVALTGITDHVCRLYQDQANAANAPCSVPLVHRVGGVTLCTSQTCWDCRHDNPVLCLDSVALPNNRPRLVDQPTANSFIGAPTCGFTDCARHFSHPCQTRHRQPARAGHFEDFLTRRSEVRLSARAISPCMAKLYVLRTQRSLN